MREGMAWLNKLGGGQNPDSEAGGRPYMFGLFVLWRIGFSVRRRFREKASFDRFGGIFASSYGDCHDCPGRFGSSRGAGTANLPPGESKSESLRSSEGRPGAKHLSGRESAILFGKLSCRSRHHEKSGRSFSKRGCDPVAP